MERSPSDGAARWPSESEGPAPTGGRPGLALRLESEAATSARRRRRMPPLSNWIWGRVGRVARGPSHLSWARESRDSRARGESRACALMTRAAGG